MQVKFSMQFSSIANTLFGSPLFIGPSKPVILGGAGDAAMAWASPDQLTLSQPEVADYANQITSTTGTPGFSEFPTALKYME